MTENVDVAEKMRAAREDTKAAAKSMVDLARAVFLAGIGAVALTRDETKAMMDKLVERGMLAESEARKIVDSVAERSKEQGEQAQGLVERQIEFALNRMSIPTRDDLAALNAKITTLSDKIDSLLAEEGSGPSGQLGDI